MDDPLKKVRRIFFPRIIHGSFLDERLGSSMVKRSAGFFSFYLFLVKCQMLQVTDHPWIIRSIRIIRRRHLKIMHNPKDDPWTVLGSSKGEPVPMDNRPVWILRWGDDPWIILGRSAAIIDFWIIRKNNPKDDPWQLWLWRWPANIWRIVHGRSTCISHGSSVNITPRTIRKRMLSNVLIMILRIVQGRSVSTDHPWIIIQRTSLGFMVWDSEERGLFSFGSIIHTIDHIYCHINYEMIEQSKV